MKEQCPKYKPPHAEEKAAENQERTTKEIRIPENAVSDDGSDNGIIEEELVEVVGGGAVMIQRQRSQRQLVVEVTVM